jgi:hypothetical protein
MSVRRRLSLNAERSSNSATGGYPEAQGARSGGDRIGAGRHRFVQGIASRMANDRYEQTFACISKTTCRELGMPRRFGARLIDLIIAAAPEHL